MEGEQDDQEAEGCLRSAGDVKAGVASMKRRENSVEAAGFKYLQFGRPKGRSK